MSKFKVGDIIRRIRPSHCPDRYGVLGMEYTVLDLCNGNPVIITNMPCADVEMFELVSAAPDDPEVRDLEEKITSLTKSLAASHIANTNLRKEVVSLCGSKDRTIAYRDARIADLSKELLAEHDGNVTHNTFLTNAIRQKEKEIEELKAQVASQRDHLNAQSEKTTQRIIEVSALKARVNRLEPDLFIVVSLRDKDMKQPILTMMGSYRDRAEAVEHTKEQAEVWSSPVYLIEGRASLKASKDSTVYLTRV